jgi:hypothetical protein
MMHAYGLDGKCAMTSVLAEDWRNMQNLWRRVHITLSRWQILCPEGCKRSFEQCYWNDSAPAVCREVLRYCCGQTLANLCGLSGDKSGVWRAADCPMIKY